MLLVAEQVAFGVGHVRQAGAPDTPQMGLAASYDQLGRPIADKDNRLVFVGLGRPNRGADLGPVLIVRQFAEILGQPAVPTPAPSQAIVFEPAVSVPQVPLLLLVAEQVPVGIDDVLQPRIRDRRQERLPVGHHEDCRRRRVENRRRVKREARRIGHGHIGRDVAENDVEWHIVRAVLCCRAGNRIELLAPVCFRDRETGYGDLDVLNCDDPQLEIGIGISRELGNTKHRLILARGCYLDRKPTLNPLEFLPAVNLRCVYDQRAGFALQRTRKHQRILAGYGFSGICLLSKGCRRRKHREHGDPHCQCVTNSHHVIPLLAGRAAGHLERQSYPDQRTAKAEVLQQLVGALVVLEMPVGQ